MNSHPPEPFEEVLRSLERTRSGMRGLLFRAGLGTAVAATLLFVALAGLSDFLGAWETGIRTVIAAAGLVLLAAGMTRAWKRAAGMPLAEVARRSDEASADPRQTVRAGLDLAREGDPSPSPLHRHLAREAADRALRQFRGTSPEQLVRKEERVRPWRRAMLAALPVLLLVLVHPAASRVVAVRLLQPWKDLAPYSPYSFEIAGESPARVIYGKDADLAVEIHGPPLAGKVELLLRPAGGGEVERIPTFREGPTRHTRRLEGVVAPLEFAFATGRARSAWEPLEVLYQPRLERAEVELAPPAYSRQSPRRFLLGSEDLRGLRGSRIRVEVESNRPLSGGILEGRDPQGREVRRRVEASLPDAGGKRVVFDWPLEEELVWTLDLVDVRGGRMEQPVTLVQHLVPDEKPRVELVEPGPVVFATPSSAVKLAWDVEDDLGIDRIDWVRSAERFRERSTRLPEGVGERRQRIQRTVALASLGVLPGQSLEFLLEARDHNPDLLGVSGSTPVRLRVISEEEYGSQLRLRTTLREFSDRYRALRETLTRAQKSLEELSRTAANGDAAAREVARAAAEERHREAASWFSAFARDFPAFVTDEALNELSGQLSDELERNLADLGRPEPWIDPARAAELAASLSARLRPGSERLDREQASADEIARLAAVMEMAAELEAIHREQRSLSDRIGRLSREMALGLTDDRGEVPTLRRRQLANRDRLRRVLEELPERLQNLPESGATLREGAEAILGALGELEVEKQMSDSAAHATVGEVSGAAEDAALALANLDQILSGKSDDFSRICQGSLPGFCQGKGLAASALAQMLEALRGRSGRSPGDGSGGGGGGGMNFGAVGGSGYAMDGIQLDIPLFGPPRVDLSRPPAGGGGLAQPGGPVGTAEGVEEAGDSVLPAGSSSPPGGRSWTPEDVPEKYRRAVERFYTQETSSAPDGSPSPRTHPPAP